MTTVSIQLPIDAEPGDSLTFYVNGENLEIEVPIGSEPGDVLEIQLGNGNGADVEPGSAATTVIPMKTGEELVLQSRLPEKEKSLNNGSCDGTHAMVWPAGLALVNFINGSGFDKLLQEREIKSVLELGSGLGLAGMAFGHLLSRSEMQCTAQVTLSDMPSALPLLDYNVQQNRHLLLPSVHISTVPLVWHCHPVSQSNSTLDVIIGSDLLYNPANIPVLVATITRLSSPTTWIILSVRWRKPDLERGFFMQLSDRIDWRVLDGSCPLSWRDYGNPASEASNTYFSQTMVGVQGKPVTLASIDESATERMTSDEFEAWEKFQTQIYLGQVLKPCATKSTPQMKRQRL